MSRYFGVFAAFSALCALLAIIRPLNFLSDDALFYLVIADHIAGGQGSTFNGLFPTNGYHPLWECIAALLAYIPHDRQSLLVYGVAVQWILSIATLAVLLRALRPWLSGAAIGVLCGVLMLLFVPFGNLFWCEAPLSMLFVAIILYMLRTPRPASYSVLGSVLGLAVLSRLDNVFLVGCALLGLWWRDRDLRLGIACAICAAIVGCYLLTNELNFGHLMPISGAIKSAFYRHRFFAGNLGLNGLLSLAAAVLLALTNLLQRWRPADYRFACIILSAGVILHALYVWALTFGDTAWVWYYVQGYLCLALLAAQIVDTLQTKWSQSSVYLGPAIFVCCLAISTAISGGKFLLNWAWHDPKALAGQWRSAWAAETEKKLPKDQSVLVVLDQPGLFAYGTTHPVFALDGLTSNYKVDSALASHGMFSQLETLGTAYLVAPVVAAGEDFRVSVLWQRGVPGGQILHFYTPLAGADAGCVRIDNSTLVSQRRLPAMLAGGVWGTWRLTPDSVRAIPCPVDMAVTPS